MVSQVDPHVRQTVSSLKERIASQRALKQPRSKFSFSRLPTTANPPTTTLPIPSAITTTTRDSAPTQSSLSSELLALLQAPASSGSSSSSTNSTNSIAELHDIEIRVHERSASTSITLRLDDPTRYEPELRSRLDQLDSTMSRYRVDATRDFTITKCIDCRVVLCGPTSALRIDSLQRCTIVATQVNGSVLIRNCSDCIFVIGTRQVWVYYLSLVRSVVRSYTHSLGIDSCEFMIRWTLSSISKSAVVQ